MWIITKVFLSIADKYIVGNETKGEFMSVVFSVLVGFLIGWVGVGILGTYIYPTHIYPTPNEDNEKKAYERLFIEECLKLQKLLPDAEVTVDFKTENIDVACIISDGFKTYRLDINDSSFEWGNIIEITRNSPKGKDMAACVKKNKCTHTIHMSERAECGRNCAKQNGYIFPEGE